LLRGGVLPASQPTAIAAPTVRPTAVAAAPTTLPTAPATAAPAPPIEPSPAPTEPPATQPPPEPTAEPTAEPTVEPPTVEPIAPPLTTTPPTPAASYLGHVVEEGETLDSIATSAGSTPDLIAQYNRLDGAPPVGRPLIVPRAAGAQGTLESQPLLVQRGRTDKPWVALTLDAGASAEPVPQILQTLRDHNLKITFFLTGKWIEENPDLTRQIVADGHEIANHTVSHPDLRHLSDAAIRAELEGTEARLAETAGATTRPLFRPPYGAYDERVLRVLVGEGYLPIYWTLDSLDSVGEPKTADFLFERVTGKLTPEQLRGAIILAHCGSQPTADALPRILDRFAEMGFEVKKVSEVLG
jgi:peptidoglycan/xylan/chitin deacetylase (PgdA/CDA1 family)